MIATPAPADIAAGPPAPPANHFDGSVLHHGPAVVLLVLVTFATYGSVLEIKPIDTDNLFSLALGVRSDPGSLFTAAVTPDLPAYRPLPYLTIWMQYRLFQFDNVAGYFGVNLLLLAGCAALIYFLVYRLSASRLAAAAVALLAVLDSRSMYCLFWIGERQSSMACLFGLLALLLMGLRTEGIRDRLQWLAVAGLLLAAMLCKEYALAFPAAALVGAWFTRRDRLAAAVAAVGGAAAVYLVLRLGVAGVPFTVMNGKQSTAYGTNFFSALGATFLPKLFVDGGGLAPGNGLLRSPLELIVCGFAALACLLRPRAVLPLLAVIAATALLNAPMFRYRNLFAGVMALYVLAGIGLALALAHAQCRGPVWRGILCCALLLLGTAMLFLERQRQVGLTQSWIPVFLARAEARDAEITFAHELAGQEFIAHLRLACERRDLSHLNPTVRQHAVHQLSAMGRAAVGAVADLARLQASDPDDAVRQAATEALASIRSTQAMSR